MDYKDARIRCLQDEIDRIKVELEWYKDFCSYVKLSERYVYNRACDHADDTEQIRRHDNDTT